MADLNLDLIQEAQSMVTDGNAQRVAELVFEYQRAALLPRRPEEDNPHQARAERELRMWVRRQKRRRWLVRPLRFIRPYSH